MVKSISKSICCVLKVLAWAAITIFLATRENDDIKMFAVIGAIGLLCFFVQFCSYLDMHIKCKNK